MFSSRIHSNDLGYEHVHVSQPCSMWPMLTLLRLLLGLGSQTRIPVQKLQSLPQIHVVKLILYVGWRTWMQKFVHRFTSEWLVYPRLGMIAETTADGYHHQFVGCPGMGDGLISQGKWLEAIDRDSGCSFIHVFFSINRSLFFLCISIQIILDIYLII